MALETYESKNSRNHQKFRKAEFLKMPGKRLDERIAVFSAVFLEIGAG